MGYAEGEPEKDRPFFAAFREGLQKMGWTEGRTIRIDIRRVTAHGRGIASAIREGTRLAAARPHFYEWHAQHGNFAATNAHHPDRLCSGIADPIGSGFVASFPRPGGNVTGFTLCSSRRWPASGWSCSRRLRRASPGSPSCSTRQRLHHIAENYLNPFKAAAASFGVEPITTSVHDTSEARIRRRRIGTRAEWRPDRRCRINSSPSTARRSHLFGCALPSPFAPESVPSPIWTFRRPLLLCCTTRHSLQ